MAKAVRSVVGVNKPLPATTTEQEDIVTRGQRAINRIWEITQAAGLTGTFTVRMKVIDPKGYRSPYPLQIAGRNADGSYTLKTITL